jgi:hypothetical protein
MQSMMKNGYSDVYSKMDLTKYTLVAMKCVNGIDPLSSPLQLLISE